MESVLKLGSRRALLLKAVPRPLRSHPFVTLLVVGVVFGGGVRFVPTSTAAVPGSNAGASGSTACAVK